MLNYYSLLKIEPYSTQEEIELAFSEFKKELLKFSPGINLSEEELRKRKPEIWEAFDVLLNEEKRKQYDEVVERERIHELYEAQIKKEEEESLKKPDKWKYIGLGSAIVIVIFYFLLQQISSKSLHEKPIWQTHYITDEVKILLPAIVDSSVNVIPSYLLTDSKKNMGYVSELSDGFSVTVARCEIAGPYEISFNSIRHIGSREMQSRHVRNRKEDAHVIDTAIYNYRTKLTKGTYQIDDVIRGYENYTLVNGNVVIKVIVNYVPGNLEHEKYCEIVFNSLMQH